MAAGCRFSAAMASKWNIPMSDSTTTADGAEIFTSEDPIALFREWMELARAKEPEDANAFALATADKAGLPDVRMVLLKDVDARGFVFYTNLESDKGRELAENSQAAICFHWKSLRRQVRARSGDRGERRGGGCLFRDARPRQSDRRLGVAPIAPARNTLRARARSDEIRCEIRFRKSTAAAALVGFPDRPCTDRILA